MDWFKFYGKDFLADLKLRKLSVVQRLMFICLLCHASDREDGIVECVDDHDLLTDCNLTSVDDGYNEGIGTLKYLEVLGIIEIKNDHIIVKKYQDRQQSNLTGAERQKRYIERKKKERHKSDVKSVTKVTAIRVEESRVEKKRVERTSAHLEKFYIFWKAYPKKLGLKKAKQYWVRDNLDEQLDKIMAFVNKANQEKLWNEQQFIPYGSSFLNSKDYLSDPKDYGAKRKRKHIDLNSVKEESEKELPF